MLKDDPVYAVKAEGSHAGLERSCPISRTLKGRVNAPRGVVAYHPPWTLQRGQNCAAASK
jgi:glycolate oxidase iron-sulfur subunit